MLKLDVVIKNPTGDAVTLHRYDDNEGLVLIDTYCVHTNKSAMAVISIEELKKAVALLQ